RLVFGATRRRFAVLSRGDLEDDLLDLDVVDHELDVLDPVDRLVVEGFRQQLRRGDGGACERCGCEGRDESPAHGSLLLEGTLSDGSPGPGLPLPASCLLAPGSWLLLGN